MSRSVAATCRQVPRLVRKEEFNRKLRSFKKEVNS